MKRRVKGEKGTLQLWIENAMTEKKRQAQRVAPQDEGSWYSQHQIMRVFDNLIYNEDRNQGNLLIDGGWKIWLIDHTRAFRRDKSLLNEALIRQCEKDLFENMQRLNESLIKKRLGRYLSPAEMKGLLIRRDLLVAYIDGLVAERGAERVFFDLPSVVIG